MTTLTQPITAEQLLKMSGVGRCELIEGEVVQMPPPGFRHGEVSSELARRIGNHAIESRLGKVVTEAGFLIARDPDTVRAPDAAFIRKDRLPSESLSGYYTGAPDLAIEVLSPSDVATEVMAKINQWLAAGATSVWLVDPANRQIQIHHATGQITRFRDADQLTDDATLPGFTLNLADLFA